MALRLDPDLTARIPLKSTAQGAAPYRRYTRTPLDTVVNAFNEGKSAEEIVLRHPTLRLADVYAVLAYPLRHRDEVDVYVLIEKTRGQPAPRAHRVSARPARYPRTAPRPTAAGAGADVAKADACCGTSLTSVSMATSRAGCSGVSLPWTSRRDGPGAAGDDGPGEQVRANTPFLRLRPPSRLPQLQAALVGGDDAAQDGRPQAAALHGVEASGGGAAGSGDQVAQLRRMLAGLARPLY